MIHTFGDSHSLAGWNAVENTIVHGPTGPDLCYSFGRERLKRLDIAKYNIQEGDTVCFCFGEIDCRCHIYKYITAEKSYKDIIDPIVKNYFEAIHENVCRYKNLTVFVYNVVPPVRKDRIKENVNFPFRGSDDERKSFVTYFNEQLKIYCVKYGYIFIDIYKYYTDEGGFLIYKLSDGAVHISDGRFIKSFLDELKKSSKIL